MHAGVFLRGCEGLWLCHQIPVPCDEECLRTIDSIWELYYWEAAASVVQGQRHISMIKMCRHP